MDDDKLVTLEDVLTAWQSGRIGYCRAMQLSGIDFVTELYEALQNCRVQVLLPPSRQEMHQAEAIVALVSINGRMPP